MKHSLQLRLSQHLTLTPQLQQSIRLLQLSTLELQQELEQTLRENPLLERIEPGGDRIPSMPEYGPAQPQESAPSADAPARSEAETEAEADSGESDWGIDPFSRSGGSPHEEGNYPQLACPGPTLREHLHSQLGLTVLPERDKRIVALLIDTLDERGYLTQDLDELAAMLPAELEVAPDDLCVALRQLQNLEPRGIGARDLSECLALQLEALPESTPYRREALEVVRHHLQLLAGREFPKLKKLFHCDDDALRAIQRLITGLNPRPAADFSNQETRYVMPDVAVKKVKGLWVAALNSEAIPRLRINRLYAEILQRNRSSRSSQLAGQLQEAKWLIKNVQQRFDTILRVSQAIVDRQRRFFEHGEVAMRPLVLREIAEALDLHESTISRVTTQKFMLTPRGIFELKYFFGSHVGTDTGGACSATAIRALIRKLVAAEDTKKPLSDSQIAEILGQQGIVVARRTVAKYRESLNVLPTHLRKTL